MGKLYLFLLSQETVLTEGLEELEFPVRKCLYLPEHLANKFFLHYTWICTGDFSIPGQALLSEFHLK
ncbi:hypothetical protein XELAEV_18017333mg [Xenopus laevis]|uniref:Uncharacterized protein n=1 Tax=Xenopus laevis TaxID=8355 RepID=A0A974DB10_XENLA|nr:hypothetical protein XELAEV_18017333mg [Xenopus laevis]